MKKLTKGIVAVIVIGLAGGYLLYQVLQSSWAYYYSVDEFVASGAGQGDSAGEQGYSQGPVIRLAGRVELGSIVRATEAMRLDFELSGEKSTVQVTFRGAEPANFAEGKEVVVEGRASPTGVFEAQKILTRCESKYRVKLDTRLQQE